ncbi:MAG: hypothetical protein NC548_05740 [Lachnospiraceae bacterium]|nr:hypothetical protein [Lachnospiraceae bacterium]
MAIKDDQWRQAILNASTFPELEKACQKLPSLHLCSDEVMTKVNTLPILSEIDDLFLNYLCSQASKNPIAYSMIKAYSTRIVESGLFDHGDELESDYIPLIVVSAQNRERMHWQYFLTCSSYLNGCDERILQALFVDGQYDTALALSKDDPDLHRIVTDYIAVLSNETAYMDFVSDVHSLHLRAGFDVDIHKAASIIAQTMQLRSSEGWTNSGLDEDDIYTWLTYLIATYSMTKNYEDHWDSNSIKMYAEDLFQSLGVVNQHIGLMETVPAQWKVDLINQLIERAHTLWIRTLDATPARINVVDKCLASVSFHPDPNDDSKANGGVQLAVSIPITERWIPDRCEIAMEDYDETSTLVDKASRKIYRGYKSYKSAEKKVDSQLTKMALALKQQFSGNPRDRIIEGEKFSVVRVIKKLVTTAAIFSYSKVAGVLYVIIKHCTGKNADNKERRAVISELKLEIKLLDEKIEDARGDGNRQAKYSMIRTRAELQKAVDQIQYGLKADQRALQTAKDVISGKRSTDYTGGRGGDETE